MSRPVRNTSEGFIPAARIRIVGASMGILDYFKKRETDIMCPECEKHKKHVKLVETDGKTVECPECHYTHLARR